MQENTNTQSSENFKKISSSKNIIFWILVFFAILLISGLMLLTIRKNKIQVAPIIPPEISGMIKIGDLKSKEAYEDSSKEYISKIPDNTRNKDIAILYRISAMTSAMESANELDRSENFREVISTMQSLKAKYENTDDKKLKDIINYNITKSFIDSCFGQYNTIIIDPSFSFNRKDIKSTIESFEKIGNYINKLEFTNDPVGIRLIANRLYINAMYLDSFSEKIPKQSKENILNLMKKDLDSFSLTNFDVDKEIIRGKFFPKFYEAYANDVYVRYTKLELTKEDNNIINKFYEITLETVNSNREYSPNSAATLHGAISMFYLGSLKARNLNDENVLIKKLVKGIEDDLKVSDASNISLTDFLSTGNDPTMEWVKIKDNFYKLRKDSNNLDSLLSSIGFKK